jgi:hypothetical protein
MIMLARMVRVVRVVRLFPGTAPDTWVKHSMLLMSNPLIHQPQVGQPLHSHHPHHF